nr:peptidase C48, SUMO/sentrin/Ubl1 [Tanacetum cinerariifolium]
MSDKKNGFVDYVYAKYENSWKENDEATDEMLDDLYNFAMIKESENGKAKLMVSDEMVEYALAKYRKKWNFKDEIVDVILEDLQIKFGKEHDKGKTKQAEHDLDGLDLGNKVKKLEEDFSRMLKAKKAKEAELKVNKGMSLPV